MALTDVALRNAKKREKPYKLADGGGLHLLVLPTGSRLWRLNYRHNGRHKTLAVGVYPAVSLADAREKRDEAKKLLAKGTDPSAQRKAEKHSNQDAQRNTFGVLTEEYLARQAESGGKGGGRASHRTVEQIRWLLTDLAKDLTNRPIREITPSEILTVLQRVEASGRRVSAMRLRSAISSVFRLAVSTLRADNDPTWPLRGALKAPVVENFAAITDEKKLGALMAAIDTYDGWPSLRSALLFTALTAVRPGMVRYAEWQDINFAQRTWRIPAEKMKMRQEHEVPLSEQALNVLERIRDFSGKCKLVFPSIRDDTRPLSENSMNSALRRMGYAQKEHTAHGFRSSFSTIMNERRYDPELIEFCLAHYEEGGKVRSIYNRARYWPGRAKLMQDWADLLDRFRELSLTPKSRAPDYTELL